MNWMDMSQRDFLAALASSSPTPGGGTASAVALGQAAALSIMVADLTLNNEKWSEGWPVAERIQHVAIPLMSASGDLAQQDSDAFDRVMASFQLPKVMRTRWQNVVRPFALRPCTLRKYRTRPLARRPNSWPCFPNSQPRATPTRSRMLVWRVCSPVPQPKGRCST